MPPPYPLQSRDDDANNNLAPRCGLPALAQDKEKTQFAMQLALFGPKRRDNNVIPLGPLVVLHLFAYI
jgi:hypothetical protein